MPKKILIVDDDADILNLSKIALSSAGYAVETMQDAGSAQALNLIEDFNPDLVLLDIMMPAVNGYDFCKKVKATEFGKNINIIFLSGLKAKENKLKAFSVGASGYMTKPFKKADLVKNINYFFSTFKKPIKQGSSAVVAPAKPEKKRTFIDALAEKFKVDCNDLSNHLKKNGNEIYSLANFLKIEKKGLAREIAAYAQIDYIEIINPEDIVLGVLPAKFAKEHNVVPIKNEDGQFMVCSNPFDIELEDVLSTIKEKGFSTAVGNPETIKTLLHLSEVSIEGTSNEKNLTSPEELNLSSKDLESLSGNPGETPVKYITSKIIESAINDRASDIHIEPKEMFYLLRFRIDGDLKEFTKLKKETGIMVLARMKAISGLDITEKRRPQDGAFSIKYADLKYTLRMATASTKYGESLVVRIINSSMRPKTLQELGMHPEQEKEMISIAQATQGIVIVAAPTGSGKTTTLYTFMSGMDIERRSLITVEDPIEYKIAKANQQQVNEKAGATFGALLKSSVRQDPDILFLGEIRDEETAKVAVDFSSTGHLTISTMHTSNATTAIFRLERLEVTRGQMAETLLALISQRLIKKLCPHCKEKYSATDEEKGVAEKFNFKLPEHLYRPKGCPRCSNTGYFSREAIYEIIRFTPVIGEMIRTGKSIQEIRDYVSESGVFLLPKAALWKLSEGVFSFKEVYEKILVEEISAVSAVNKVLEKKPETKVFVEKNEKNECASSSLNKKILIVDDDSDLRALAEKIISNAGYETDTASDGVEAIIKISQNSYGLVLSDIDMPNLDGIKLVEMISQKNLNTKVIIMTASREENSEFKVLTLGASDFIKKPFKKDILLLRIKKVLKN
jgi:type IV pilus assembly protein PilB